MTPHKHSAGGTFIVDRSFKGIGRVHRASGITREATFALFNDCLSELAGDTIGREWLRAFQRGQIEGLDLWGKVKTGAWRKAPPRPETSRSLVDSLTKWREDHKPTEKSGVSEDTYRVRKECITAAERYGRAGATVEELPTVLRAIKAGMSHAPAQFNHLRNYFRAYLRDTLGKRHELYQIVQFDIGPIPIRGHAKKKERKRHPLTPADVQLLASKFSTAAAGGGTQDGHGHSAIAMAMTGMHPKEYYVDGFSVSTRYVHVHGEKREGRDRKVPKLFPSKLWPHLTLKQPEISDPKTFGRAFRAARKAAKLICTPLDLRRSFATWMEAAGIERTRRRMYLGHSARDVTDLYETQELLPHLAADGAKLRAWIDQQLDQRPRLVAEEGR